MTGGQVDEQAAVEIWFCPECEGYSYVARDGEIPHTAGCSEPESVEFVPRMHLAAAERALESSVSKGLYQAQVEANVAQRAELDVALRQRAEAERERKRFEFECDSLLAGYEREKTARAAAESRAEAAETERDELRQLVVDAVDAFDPEPATDAQREVVPRLHREYDRTTGRKGSCSCRPCALARESSPAGEGDN